MKQKKRIQNMLTQLGYEHKKLDKQLIRVRKSADELNKILENMTPKEKEKEEK